MATVFTDQSLRLYITMTTRDTLVKYISLNKDVFVKFTPSTTESFDKHLQGMEMKGTWAIYLEIFAAASLLQIPIYVATQRSKTMVYYWEVYNSQCYTSLQHFPQKSWLKASRIGTCTEMSL